MSVFQTLVGAELIRAITKYGTLASGHEAYAVILEELEEFWECCRKWKGEAFNAKALEELVQIAAMAERAAYDLGCVQRLLDDMKTEETSQK